jgi:hypothetical protein
MSGCRKECRCPRWGAGRVGCAAVVCKALHPVLCARMASGRYPSRITGLRSRHIMHQRTRCSLRIPGPRLSQVRCTFVYMHALLVDLTSPCVPPLTIPCLVHVFCVRLRQTRSHTLARCVSLALSDTHTFPRLTHPRSPVWAPLEGLLAAMQTTDKASSQPRGLLLLLPPEERC